MSTSSTPLLTTCGCCGGSGASAAAAQQNPPGLSAIAYRAGTHGSFTAGMLDSISGTPGINGLTVRDTQDPSIALMDAWAVVLDVLTFYQERIANEGYLRTATERLSVGQLAAEIAYQLNPGVAAEAQLAFTMDNLPGSPTSVFLDIGTKVQSVPAQNQTAQVFETVEPITAMLDWNLFGAKQTLAPLALSVGQTILYVSGIATNLQKGDALLLLGDEKRNDSDSEVWDVRQVATITLDTTRGVTAILLDQPLTVVPQNPQLYALRQRAGLFGANAPDWRLLPLSVQLPYLGYTASQTANWTVVPPGVTIPTEWPGLTLDMLTDSPAIGSTSYGLTAEIFSDTNFSTLSSTRTVYGLLWTIDAGRGEGLDTLSASSVRLTGWLLSGAAGSYSFQISADTSLSGTLYLDGAQLPFFNIGAAFVTLEANRFYTLRFDVLFQPEAIGANGGAYAESAQISVKWAGPNISTQAVPIASLFTTSIYTVHLDTPYPKIVGAGSADSWAVLSASGNREVYQITEAVDSSRRNFTLSAKTTRLRLNGPNLSDFDDLVRDTLVLAQSEALQLAESPDTSSVQGTSITIDKAGIAQLPSGRTLLVTGISSADGSQAAEIVTLDSTDVDPDGNVILSLQSALVNSYIRISVQIYANVAESTNGETKTEILGSGDGSIPNQTFTLRQNPLTYTQAATASGGASTLQVRVNGLLWTEIPSFFTAGPSDRVYTSRIADDGTVSVNFGDGVAGLRLPTGTANVTATYRVGTGLAGMVAPNQVSMLLTRPLGLKNVTNPLAPTGAADPEARDEARTNAPLTVLTLDRIVSIDDYQNFARAFSGIAKARADWFWEGEQTPVFVTVAPSSGAPAPAGADPYDNLRAAIDAARDPAATVRVASYTPVFFGVTAAVLVNTPTYVAADVLTAVTAALTSAFSFSSRDLAQPVFSSEVSAIIQSVPGVVASQITRLWSNYERPAQSLAANSAYAERQSDGTYIEHPAELLTLAPTRLVITEMTQL